MSFRGQFPIFVTRKLITYYYNKQCNEEIGIINFDILASGFKNYWERVSYEASKIKQLRPKINIQNATSTFILRVFV